MITPSSSSSFNPFDHELAQARGAADKLHRRLGRARVFGWAMAVIALFFAGAATHAFLDLIDARAEATALQDQCHLVKVCTIPGPDGVGGWCSEGGQGAVRITHMRMWSSMQHPAVTP